MKNLILLTSLSVVLSVSAVSCSGLQTTREWDTTEKTMFATNQAIRTIDMMQTSYIFANAAFHEINPILVAGVSVLGPLFVPIYFVGVGIAEYLILDQIENPTYRKVAIGALTAVSVGLVYHNNAIGIGLSSPR